MNELKKDNVEAAPAEYGWILVFLDRWIPSAETKKARKKLISFLEKNGFLKMTAGVYAKSERLDSWEKWKTQILPFIPRDGRANIFAVTQKQWDNMTIYPSQDKF